MLLLLALIFTTHLHQSQLPSLSVFVILTDLTFAFHRLRRWKNCSLFLILVSELFLLDYIIEAIGRRIGCVLRMQAVVVSGAL